MPTNPEQIFPVRFRSQGIFARGPDGSRGGEAASSVGDRGALIINADDWGRSSETTDRILECVRARSVSSVSAMVFMPDSERAAAIARENGLDAGLHLNFTLSFSVPTTSPRLLEHQNQLARFLRKHRFAPLLFHPGLKAAFEYVVAAQREEFVRLYGSEPARFDGHHHMHLCSNVLFGGLIPPGTLVRRSFSFARAEKSCLNRLYRWSVDETLARTHRVTDYFFSLAPVHPTARLQRLFALARNSTVEMETHPANGAEHQFLKSGEIFRWTGEVSVAGGFALPEGRAW